MRKLLVSLLVLLACARAGAFGTNAVVASPWTTTTNAAAALAALGGGSGSSGTATNLSGNALLQATNIASGAAAAATVGMITNRQTSAITLTNAGNALRGASFIDAANDFIFNGTVSDAAGDYLRGGIIADAAGDQIGNGVVVAQYLAGSGVFVTNIPTANLTGTLSLTNLPPLVVTNGSISGSGGITGSVVVAGSTMTLNLGNTNGLPAGVVTNGGFVQKCISWNIPVPDASYDAASQSGASTNLYDDTGNYNCQEYWGISLQPILVSPSIMNGQPGFTGFPYSMWTNSALVAGGKTNFTIFIVYKDTAQLYYGSALFSDGNYFSFNTYAIDGNGTHGYWSEAGAEWGANFLTYGQQNQNVQCAVLRAGVKSVDPTIWQDGTLMQSIGMPGNRTIVPSVTFLTNSIYIFSPPGGLSSVYGGWIGEIKIYLSSLSDQDVRRLHNYYFNRYRINPRAVILGGDSITAGVRAAGNSNLTHCVSRLLPNWEVCNSSYPGLRTDGIYTNLLRMTAQGKWPAGTFYTQLSGANDAIQLASASAGFNLFTNYTTLCAGLLVTNKIPFFLVTHYSTLTEEVTYPGFRTNVNNWIYANAVTNLGAAGIIDLSTNPLIGPLGSYTNGLYITQRTEDGSAYDQLHLATNSYPLIYAPAVVQAIKSVQ